MGHFPATTLSSRPELPWACGPPKVMKNASVEQPPSMNRRPFLCHPEEQQLACLRQVQGGMNMAKRCLHPGPEGRHQKSAQPGRAGSIARRRAPEVRHHTRRLFIRSGELGGRVRGVITPFTASATIEGCPWIAFETWDPCNRTQMETQPFPLSSRSVPGFPTSQLSPAPLMWFSLKRTTYR